jgi:Antitoxin VbhA
VVNDKIEHGPIEQGASMSKTIPSVASPAERARRFALEQAEHSGEMEGLHVDPATRADAEEYIAGRIEIDELVARTRARYGLG